MTDSEIKQLMLTYNVPVISYAVIKGNKIIKTEAISQVGDKTSTDSLFQACSLSKSITAFAVLQLATQGKIQLDAPIKQQLKTWHIPKQSKNDWADEVTPQKCLNMTSGLRYGVPGTSQYFAPYKQGSEVPNLEQCLNGEKPATNPAVSIEFKPGTQYAYSGVGFMVLAKLIEDVTGMSFRDYMQEKVLAPLGMKNSTFACPLDESLRVKAVSGYDSDNRVLPDGWYNNPSAAAGGLWTTPTDLAHFLIAINDAIKGNSPFISKPLAQKMMQHTANTLYGLGFVVDREKSHTLNYRKIGYNEGYHAQFLMFPETGDGIVVMTDHAPTEFIASFIQAMAKEERWPKFAADFQEIPAINLSDLDTNQHGFH